MNAKERAEIIAQHLEKAVDRNADDRTLDAAHKEAHAAGAPLVLFDMANYLVRDAYEDPRGELCGTAGCIAGWTVYLFNKRGEYEPSLARLSNWEGGNDGSIKAYAARVLELSDMLAEHLFEPTHEHVARLQDIRPQDAAAAVRRAVEGREPWPKR